MDLPYQNCLSDFDLDFLDQAATSNRTPPVTQCAVARKKGIARLKDKLKSVSQVVIKAKQTAEFLEEFQKETQEIKVELEETKNLLFEKNKENTVICAERNRYYNQATKYSNELQAVKERLKIFEDKEFETNLKDQIIQGYSQQVKGLKAEVDSMMDTKKQNDKGTSLALLRANKSKDIIERKLARVLKDYVFPSTKKPDRWLQGLLKKYLNNNFSGYQEVHTYDEADRLMMSPLNLDHKEDENLKMEKSSVVPINTATYPIGPKDENHEDLDPALNRNISIDLECIGSVDTGRGSSLAFSDGEKSFHSPDYYMHDSPINNVPNLCNRCNMPRKDVSTSPIPYETCDIEDNLITNPIKKHSVITKRDACTSPMPTERLNVATDTADISFEKLIQRQKADASTSPEKCDSCINTKIPSIVIGKLDHTGGCEESRTKCLGFANYESPATSVKLRDILTSVTDVGINNIHRVERPADASMTSIIYDSDESQTNHSIISSHQPPTSLEKIRDNVIYNKTYQVVRSDIDVIERPARDSMSRQIDESQTNHSLKNQSITPEKLSGNINIDTEIIVRNSVDTLNNPTNDLIMSETDDHGSVTSCQSPTTPMKLQYKTTPNAEEIVNDVDKIHNSIEDSTPLETEDHDDATDDCMSITSRERTSEKQLINIIDEVDKYASTESLTGTLAENFDETLTDNYTIFYEEIPTNSTKPLTDSKSYKPHVSWFPHQVKECLESNNSKHFSSDADTDSEIQTILSKMRLGHRLITPIPTTPPKRIRQPPRLSNDRDIDISTIADDVNERINLVRNNLKSAFRPLLQIPELCEQLTYSLCSESNQAVFRNLLELTTDNLRTTYDITSGLAVSKPNENITSVLSTTEERSKANKNKNSGDSNMLLEHLELDDIDQITRKNYNNKTNKVKRNTELLCEAVKDKHSPQITDLVASVPKNINTIESSQNTHVVDLNRKSTGFSTNNDADIPQKYIESDNQVLSRNNNNCKNKNICEDSPNKTLTTKTRKLTKLEKLRLKMVPKSKIRSDIKPKKRKPCFKPQSVSNYTSETNSTQNKKPKEADTSASLNEESVYQKAVKVMAASKIVGFNKVPRIVVEDCTVTMINSPYLRRTGNEIEEKVDKMKSTSENTKEVKHIKRNLLQEFETVTDVSKIIQKTKALVHSSFADKNNKSKPLPFKRKRSSSESEDAAQGFNDTLHSHELNTSKKIKMTNSDLPSADENLITLKDLGLQPDPSTGIEKTKPRRFSRSTCERSLENTNSVNKTLDYQNNNNNSNTSNREGSDSILSRLECESNHTVEPVDIVNLVSKTLDNKRRSSRLNSLEKLNDNVIDFNEVIYKPINRRNQTTIKDESNALASTRKLRSSIVNQSNTGSRIEHENIALNTIQAKPKKARCRSQQNSNGGDIGINTISSAAESDKHNTVVSYDDLSLFSNQEDCPQDDQEQNRTAKIEVSVKSYSNNILCRSIEKHGKQKIHYVAKKIPECKVKEVCSKLESSISHILEIAHDQRVGAMKRLVADIKGWNVKLFLLGFMDFLRSRERKNELFSKKTCPPVPPMTKTEQVLLYVVDELQHCYDYQSIVKKLLMNIEYALFAINKTGEDFDVIEAMSHFYALLCRSYQKFSQLRLFILDSMYCLQFKSIILIKQCLEVWMSVLPLAHMGVAKTPLISCMVYLLHFYKCDDKMERIQDIRFILKRKYSYDFNDWNETKILDLFKTAIAELKDVPLERKMLRLALIILSKRNGPKWCQNNIVKKILKPMIEDSSTSIVAKLFCISVLGPLLKPYPNNMKVHCEMITDYLLDMLNQTHCQRTREAIVTSLVCLTKQNNRVLEFLVKWNPKDISSEFELVLRDYIRTKPVKAWKTILSQIDY